MNQTGVIDPKTSSPRPRSRILYKVLLLNDDYTPMEFVIHMSWSAIFRKEREEATRIMLHVHQKGVGICGVYTYEDGGNQGDPSDGLRKRRNIQHPLQCTMEKE